MKKIIAAFDGLKYSKSTKLYALDMAKYANMHMVGVFLDDPTYTSYNVYDAVVKKGIPEAKLRKLEESDRQKRLDAAEDFRKACERDGVEFTIHHDHDIAIHELKHESIYADMMVIDMNETLTHYTENPPTRFIRDLLGDSQCPILLVPGRYKPIDKIIMLFDGEPSAVHAIKMFSYMLNYMKDYPTEVICVKTPGSSLNLPDNTLMREFMKRHFPKATYTVLKGLPEEAIVTKLKEEKSNALLVLGAYRRGTVSRWFRESMADTLMKKLKLPLFIAHNK